MGTIEIVVLSVNLGLKTLIVADNTNIWGYIASSAIADFTLVTIYIRTMNNTSLPSELRNIGTKGLCLKWDNNSIFVAMVPAGESTIYVNSSAVGSWQGWKKITPQSY